MSYDIFQMLHIFVIPSRDLKPDNVLLDAMGHVHLTDFNVAIHYSDRRMHTSVAGSLAYMAPEIFARKGYTWCVDWWSLGVVAWELFFHRRPFDHRTSERMQAAILKDPIKLPSVVLKDPGAVAAVAAKTGAGAGANAGASAIKTGSNGSANGGKGSTSKGVTVSVSAICSPEAQDFILGVCQ